MIYMKILKKRGSSREKWGGWNEILIYLPLYFFVCNVVCAADLIIVSIYEAYRLMFSTCFPFERFDNG
jgi:hypothetical protein